MTDRLLAQIFILTAIYCKLLYIIHYLLYITIYNNYYILILNFLL